MVEAVTVGGAYAYAFVGAGSVCVVAGVRNGWETRGNDACVGRKQSPESWLKQDEVVRQGKRCEQVIFWGAATLEMAQIRPKCPASNMQPEIGTWAALKWTPAQVAPSVGTGVWRVWSPYKSSNVPLLNVASDG